MPPTRRKSSLATQKTLAFGPVSNKVTKPSLPPSSKKLSKPLSQPSPLAQVYPSVQSTPSPAPKSESEVEQEDSERTNALEAERRSGGDGGEEKVAVAPKSPGGRLAIRNAKVLPRSEVEERAGKIGEAEVRRYWVAKEEERKAKRVHQEGLSIHEKILRHFDLSSQYGPCVGIARMKRWKRADALGLKPPIEVLAVLMKEEAKENKEAERAYMDELLSTQIVVD